MERVLVNTVKQLDKLTEKIVKLKENTAVNFAPQPQKPARLRILQLHN